MWSIYPKSGVVPSFADNPRKPLGRRPNAVQIAATQTDQQNVRETACNPDTLILILPLSSLLPLADRSLSVIGAAIQVLWLRCLPNTEHLAMHYLLGLAYVTRAELQKRCYFRYLFALAFALSSVTGELSSTGTEEASIKELMFLGILRPAVFLF